VNLVLVSIQMLDKCLDAALVLVDVLFPGPFVLEFDLDPGI